MTSRREVLRVGASLTLAAPGLGAAVKAAPSRSGPPGKAVHVDAPFAMPDIEIPDFSAMPRFSILRFGARLDDQARTSAALTHAIEAAHRAGGGRVVVPAGLWPTAGLRLKDGVDLHLEQGATLLFSPDPADYLPAVPSSWEGVECMNYAPLIYAHGCHHVAITGRGRLVAQMSVWQAWAARPQAHLDALVALYQMARAGTPTEQRDMTRGAAHLRPQFMQFNRCAHVLIEGVSIENSPFWTIHLYLSRDVVIRGVSIRARGHNNDGVDPEMSQNVLIEDCIFDQGDDAVSVKSGREEDAWRLATPSRNIVMRGCTVYNGHQLMAVGSELSGGVENVWVDHCRVDQRGQGETNSAFNNLLFIKTNERRGGFVRNIHMTNIAATTIAGGVLTVDTDVLYQWRELVPTYQRRLTPIEGVHIAHVTVERAAWRVSIKGEATLPVRDVSLSDVHVGTSAGGTALDHVTAYSDL